MVVIIQSITLLVCTRSIDAIYSGRGTQTDNQERHSPFCGFQFHDYMLVICITYRRWMNDEDLDTLIGIGICAEPLQGS
jgi:hypothetical protein